MIHWTDEGSSGLGGIIEVVSLSLYPRIGNTKQQGFNAGGKCSCSSRNSLLSDGVLLFDEGDRVYGLLTQ